MHRFLPRYGDGTFSQEDYQLIAKAERIRNASDYDDFYIASKEETQQQVSNAEYIVRKIEKYIFKETENMESVAENES